MTLIRRLVGLAADTALGLPLRAGRYDIEPDVAVPMPDGVSLLGNLYRPAGRRGPLPVVLVRLPYGRSGMPGQLFAAPLARRGFQVFLQATRGTFGSGGHFRPFTTEREDGLATVAWLREQPWCDGRVAMTGLSYFGHTQWAVAPYVDPPLQAVDVAVAGAPVPFWRDFVAHSGPGDDFWSVADHGRADFHRMPPVNMVTGWWDVFAAGQLADYSALRAAGVPARIVVGPWLHGEAGELRAIARSDVEFLRHTLSNGPAPSGAPVRVFLQQADTWLEFDHWPPPHAQQLVQHVRAGGALSVDAEDGDVAPSRFTYDPADPTPTVGGPLLQRPGKQADNRSVEDRADVLVFTGPPLPSDLDVVGQVRARVHVRSELEHADVFVRLCDVDPTGASRNVVDGIRRLDPRTVPADDVEVCDDGVLAVDVELYPTAYRVRAGHRLRLQVSGGAFPRYARSLGTAEPFGTATEGRSCRFEVHHDAAHPSRLVLPVVR